MRSGDWVFVTATSSTLPRGVPARPARSTARVMRACTAATFSRMEDRLPSKQKILSCYDDPSAMSGQRGKFITFEGIDGSGKTTQLETLAERLRARGILMTTAQEPGGTPVGAAIRRILLDSATARLSPVAELLLYFASRAQNVEEVIRPALDAGQVVLCDRYVDASAAYQGCGRGLGLEVVSELERIACGGLKPDLTFLLDIEPASGVARALERNRRIAAAGQQDENRFERESLEFFASLRRAYLDIAAREPGRVIVVSGERTRQAIHADIWEQTKRVLGIPD